MAYVVPRSGGSWELRESRSTADGPRSRTLASFRTLTPEIVERAIARAGNGLTPAEVRRAAVRAGAPVARSASDEAAATLLGELAEGRAPSPGLRRLLADALPDQERPPSAAERAAAGWVAATPDERGRALRDLLLLADRLPARRGAPRPAFPRLASAER